MVAFGLRVLNLFKIRNSIGYYGIYRNGKSWFSCAVSIDKVKHYLGCFDTPLEAALVYDDFVRKNNLDRRLNFPDPEPENLIPNTRLIRLTQGKFAVVDEDMFEELNKYDWIAHFQSGTWYAIRSKYRGKGKSTGRASMHAAVMGRDLVDHINHNGLHNFRENLRLCDASQNQFNKRPQKNGTSIYKGVYWHSQSGTWRAQITVYKKVYHLGNFKNEIDAAKAYDAKAKEFFGEWALLNFQ